MTAFTTYAQGKRPLSIMKELKKYPLPGFFLMTIGFQTLATLVLIHL